LRSIESGTFVVGAVASGCRRNGLRRLRVGARRACPGALLWLVLCGGCLLPDSHLARQPAAGMSETAGRGSADEGVMSAADAGDAGARPANSSTRSGTAGAGGLPAAMSGGSGGASAKSGAAGRSGAGEMSAGAGRSGLAGTSAGAGRSAAGGTSAGAGKPGAAGRSETGGMPADAGKSGAAGKPSPAPTPAVNLGTAASYVILAKSGISTVPTSAVTGDLGVSPAAATSITGFSLIADSTNVFSTSTQVTGKVYAADYAPPTPSNLTTAVHDMQLAFTDAAGRAPDVTELGAGNIGGMTLTPGIYKWSTGLLIPTTVTLTGSATDVWIFQIAKDLTMSSAAKILLTGGALPKNIFWQVSGLVDLGTTAHCEGVVLTQTAVTLKTGASIKGRLLAQTAVTLNNSNVVAP
jgi:hypothetical protein